MAKLTCQGLALLCVSLTLILTSCLKPANDNDNNKPIISESADGDLGVEVSGLPESGAIDVDPVVGDEGEASSPQATVVEPPCEWPAEEISFAGNAPVYKSNAVDETAQDLSTQLSWNITTGCAPDKVIITTPHGTSEYAGARAQSWSKDIPKLEETTSYTLVIIHKNEVVHEESVEIPLVVMEDNFQVSVTAVNKVTGSQHMSWTPQQNYQDPRTYKVSYSFSAELDKVCIRSPHGTAPSRFQQNRNLRPQQRQLDRHDFELQEAIIQNRLSRWIGDALIGVAHAAPLQVDPLYAAVVWVDGAPKAPTVSGYEECFGKDDSVLDAQGKNYEGEFEFELNGSTAIESYGMLNGVKIFEKSTPLNVTIVKPSSDFAAKRAIPGVGAKHYDLVENGLSSVIEFKVEFSDSVQAALVTDVATKLYSESTWTASDTNMQIINGTQAGTLPAAKSAVCDIDPDAASTSSTIKPCTDAGFTANFIDKIKTTYPNRHMNVFKFNVHDLAESYYYAKASQFKTKSALVGVGYEDYLQQSETEATEIPEPGIRFTPTAEYSSDYVGVNNFCSNGFKNTLFAGAQSAILAGETRGVKSMEIRQTGCDSNQGSTDVHPYYGEPGVINFNSKCFYDGMNPGYTVTTEDLLGNETNTTCKFNVTMWDIKLQLTSKTDNLLEDRYGFKLEKIEQPGPDPIKELKVVKVDSHCGGAFLNTAVNVEDDRDYERTFDVTNQGVDCWKIAVQAKTYDGWKYVTWTTHSQQVKNTGYQWHSKSISKNTRGNNETAFFPPRMHIDKWQRTSSQCWSTFTYIGACSIACTIWNEKIDKYEADYKLSGRHIDRLEVTCNRGSLSGVSVSGSDRERFVDKALSYSSNANSDVRTKIKYDCEVTATGVGDQPKLTRSFARWAKAEGNSCTMGNQ